MILCNLDKSESKLVKIKTKQTQENDESLYLGNDKQNKQLDIYELAHNNKEKHFKQRKDLYGNPIIKKGKQRVTFSNQFVDIIKIKSYKDYNKTEEIKSNKNFYNNCCLLV